MNVGNNYHLQEDYIFNLCLQQKDLPDTEKNEICNQWSTKACLYFASSSDKPFSYFKQCLADRKPMLQGLPSSGDFETWFAQTKQVTDKSLKNTAAKAAAAASGATLTLPSQSSTVIKETLKNPNYQKIIAETANSSIDLSYWLIAFLLIVSFIIFSLLLARIIIQCCKKQKANATKGKSKQNQTNHKQVQKEHIYLSNRKRDEHYHSSNFKHRHTDKK